MKIKQLREKLGISQRELSKKINLSPQNLNRYENEINEPDIETLTNIADYFNVSIDELVGRETENLNLKFVGETKKQMIKQILALDDNTAERVNAFLQGMMFAEQERQEIIQRIKGQKKDD